MSEQRACIVSNRQVADGIWQMDLSGQPDTMQDFAPGRFVQVKIPGAAHLILRRPFGINTYDEEKGTFSFVYQVKGEGTRILSGIKQGEMIEYLGPLGNGFSIPASVHKIWFVGGGLGIAPLLAAAEKTIGINCKALLGYKSKAHAYQADAFERCCKKVSIVTDDGSLGEKGLITDLLKKELLTDAPDLMLVCGPPVMLKAVQEFMKERPDIQCQVSLEERMACGVGACRGCVCRIGTKDNWEYQRVCKEGPVFNMKEVVFDDES